MDPTRLLKLLGLIDQHVDTSTWTQVAKLKPEDLTKSKVLEADLVKANGEIDVLRAKIMALKANLSATGAEWWEYLHQTYSLPRDGTYSIESDGSIRMSPRKPKN